MRKPVLGILIGVVLGVLLVGPFVWAKSNKPEDQAVLNTSLAHQLLDAGLCANTLTVIRKGDIPKAIKLLETQLDNAVRNTQSLLDQGASLETEVPGQKSPNLVDGMRRAAEYLHQQDPASQQAAAADAIVLKLHEAGQ